VVELSAFHLVVWDVGVSINGGTPKWMVYKGNPIEIDDLGVTPFMETPIY